MIEDLKPCPTCHGVGRVMEDQEPDYGGPGSYFGSAVEIDCPTCGAAGVVDPATGREPIATTTHTGDFGPSDLAALGERATQQGALT